MSLTPRALTHRPELGRTIDRLRWSRLLLCIAASPGARPFCAATAPPQPGVRVRLRGREILAAPGETLRSALLRRGLSPHNGRSKEINCRGLGTCGTCAIRVCQSSTAQLLPVARTGRENLRLSLPPHRPPLAPQLRLACQCRIGPATAGPEPPVLELFKHSGFWGSESDLSAESADEFALPLGDLEFVLDRGVEVAAADAASKERAAVEQGNTGVARAVPASTSGNSPAAGVETGSDCSGGGSLGGMRAGETARAGAPVCTSCGGSQMAPCPSCDGCGRYAVNYKIPDLPAMPDGSRPVGTMEVKCASCQGRGTVICRVCFSGDPYDLEAVRAIMRSKPD